MSPAADTNPDLPRQCWAADPGAPEDLVLVRNGHTGFFPPGRLVPPGMEAGAFADRCNQRAGVDPATARRMVTAAVHGWHSAEQADAAAAQVG